MLGNFHSQHFLNLRFSSAAVKRKPSLPNSYGRRSNRVGLPWPFLSQPDLFERSLALNVIIFLSVSRVVQYPCREVLLVTKSGPVTSLEFCTSSTKVDKSSLTHMGRGTDYSIESYRFVIQKVPSSHNRPRGIQDTTCRHSECPHRVTPPGSYRASLEKLADCDPANNVISYEAIDSLRNVQKTSKGSQGRRGLGTNGQEWWCLKCLEALFVHLRECIWKHKPDGSTRFVHPLTSIQYWIIPERRTILQFEATIYMLQSPQVYLLAKWQAVKTFDELRDWPAEGQFDLPEDPVDGPVTLYLGQDGESFYLDRAARELRGLLKDSRVCEVDANEVRGYSLSEAFRQLDKKEDRMVEDKWKPITAERRRTAERGAEQSGCTERQLAGSSEDREHEAGLPAQGESSESMSDAEESERTRPIIYVGNETLEKSGKRKRDDLDQTGNPARLSTLVPQASTLAQIPEPAEKGPQAHSTTLHLPRPLHDPALSFKTPASSTAVPYPRSTADLTRNAALPSSTSSHHKALAIVSLHTSEDHASEAGSFSPVSSSRAGGRYMTRAEGSSPQRAHSIDPTPEIIKEDPRADAKRRKPPTALASQANLASFAFPAAQPVLPLKFAPKRSSRLCNNKESRKDKEKPGD